MIGWIFLSVMVILILILYSDKFSKHMNQKQHNQLEKSFRAERNLFNLLLKIDALDYEEYVNNNINNRIRDRFWSRFP